MKVDLSQAEEYFQKYYEKLIWESLFARAHLKLWERLESYGTSYLKELKQAPHFFNLTIKAHYDDALLTLSRILDQSTRADPLCIWKFLNSVENNLEIFSDEAFSQREREKPDYYEDRMRSHIPITIAEVQEHREKLKSLEETINKLSILRDKVIAHIDRQFLLTGKKEHPLERQQLQQVIDALLKILNRYSAAYSSSTFEEQFSGEDDVQYVMDSLRFKKEERKKQLETWKRQAQDRG